MYCIYITPYMNKKKKQHKIDLQFSLKLQNFVFNTTRHFVYDNSTVVGQRGEKPRIGAGPFATIDRLFVFLVSFNDTIFQPLKNSYNRFDEA